MFCFLLDCFCWIEMVPNYFVDRVIMMNPYSQTVPLLSVTDFTGDGNIQCKHSLTDSILFCPASTLKKKRGVDIRYFM